SRRRHTRWPRDWSSDVCSSDLSLWRSGAVSRSAGRCSRLPLQKIGEDEPVTLDDLAAAAADRLPEDRAVVDEGVELAVLATRIRSEERRVGKECRWGWWTCRED